MSLNRRAEGSILKLFVRQFFVMGLWSNGMMHPWQHESRLINGFHDILGETAGSIPAKSIAANPRLQGGRVLFRPEDSTGR